MKENLALFLGMSLLETLYDFLRKAHNITQILHFDEKCIFETKKEDNNNYTSGLVLVINNWFYLSNRWEQIGVKVLFQKSFYHKKSVCDVITKEHVMRNGHHFYAPAMIQNKTFHSGTDFGSLFKHNEL